MNLRLPGQLSLAAVQVVDPTCLLGVCDSVPANSNLRDHQISQRDKQFIISSVAHLKSTSHSECGVEYHPSCYNR